MSSSSPRVSRALSSPIYKQEVVHIDEAVQAQLDAVRERAAKRTAVKALKDARIIDGVKVGVAEAISTRDRDSNERFLRKVVSSIKHSLMLTEDFLFAIFTSDPHLNLSPVVIVGSNTRLVEKASTLACAKFLGRLKEIYTEGELWLGYVEDEETSEIDLAMLWDIVLKTPHVINPLNPPRGSRSIVDIVAAARTRLERVTPKQALDELHDLTFPLPIVLVDIRTPQQRQDFGEIPDSLVVDRNSLEWKFDPRSDQRLSIADRYDLRVIVFDLDGNASSLAAVSLHDIGLLNSTDIIGGFRAWKEAGLPTFQQPSPSLCSNP